jgi:hypothetical protein
LQAWLRPTLGSSKPESVLWLAEISALRVLVSLLPLGFLYWLSELLWLVFLFDDLVVVFVMATTARAHAMAVPKAARHEQRQLVNDLIRSD